MISTNALARRMPMAFSVDAAAEADRAVLSCGVGNDELRLPSRSAGPTAKEARPYGEGCRARQYLSLAPPADSEIMSTRGSPFSVDTTSFRSADGDVDCNANSPYVSPAPRSTVSSRSMLVSFDVDPSCTLKSVTFGSPELSGSSTRHVFEVVLITPA